MEAKVVPLNPTKFSTRFSYESLQPQNNFVVVPTNITLKLPHFKPIRKEKEKLQKDI